MKTFSGWLLSELEKRSWSQSDLARATGLTRQAISYYVGSRSKRPDDDAVRSIARALKLPAEDVFRALGVLPSDTSGDDEWTRANKYKLSQLHDPALREVADKLLSNLLDQEAASRLKPRRNEK